MRIVSHPSRRSSIPQSDRRVLVLVGPTACGKTPVSLLLANLLGAEIISADSRQVYKFFDIGTAKPTVGERQRVRHYFIDELTPDEAFNAGEFGIRGREIIDEIFRRGKQPLVVGGSGLYVQSLVDGFFDSPPEDDELRGRLYEQLRKEGGSALLDELRRIDPVSAARMLPTNTRRIIRAIEVYHLTGIPISQHHASQEPQRDFMPVIAGLAWNRKKLYGRINARVDRMIEAGLIEEVHALRRKGYRKQFNALQTVGYQEVFAYLDGRLAKERMIELIKQNSRRYAKRQLTWFRRDPRIKWFFVSSEEDFEDVAHQIAAYFGKF